MSGGASSTRRTSSQDPALPGSAGSLESNPRADFSGTSGSDGGIDPGFRCALSTCDAIAGRYSCVDFGSGMGIPAVPLALFRPDLDIRAIDKARKKTAFLRQVVMELALPNLTVLEGRAEDIPPQEAGAGTAKAAGSPTLLTTWWMRHGQKGAPLWALKGPTVESEPVPEGWAYRLHPYRLPSRGSRQILELYRP